MTARRVRVAVAVAAVVVVAGIYAVLPGPGGHAPAGPSEETAFVGAINGIRLSQGAKPLAVDPRLTTLARSWAMSMAAANVLSHNPNLAGRAPAGWAELGENVGVGSTVAQVEAAFVASPEHLANMVDRRFTTVGTGVVAGGNRLWVVEDYMATTPAVTAPPVTLPRPPPTPPTLPTTTTTDEAEDELHP